MHAVKAHLILGYDYSDAHDQPVLMVCKIIGRMKYILGRFVGDEAKEIYSEVACHKMRTAAALTILYSQVEAQEPSLIVYEGPVLLNVIHGEGAFYLYNKLTSDCQSLNITTFEKEKENEQINGN